jgi:hypothetical protein
MWYLGYVTQGVAIKGFTTGSPVYFNVLPHGRVRVIGLGGVTAVLTLAEATKRLKCERTAGGRPIRVRDQGCRWDRAREGRRFDGRPQRIAA